MALQPTDPLVFARDECGDLIVPLRLASGLEGVLILVRSAIRLWRDEYFLNRDIGVEWLETEDGVVPERDAILGQPYDPAKLQRALRRQILATTGVRSVAGFRASFDPSERSVSVSCVVVSVFGSAPVSVTVTA